MLINQKTISYFFGGAEDENPDISMLEKPKNQDKEICREKTTFVFK